MPGAAVDDQRSHLPTALGLSALGVYLLVVGGATAAVADAASACSTWPLCDLSMALSDLSVLVAVVHRLIAAVVGVLVLATAALASRHAASRRIAGATYAALALYPLQVVVGAVVATTGAGGATPGVHLTIGLAIFGSLLVALAWQLEAETGDADESLPDPDPIPAAEGDDGGAPDEAPDGPVTPLAERSLAARLRTRVLAYVRLTKPRLMWLLCLVAAAGMALAAGPALAVRTVVLTLGGGVLAIGASGTFNHVLERDIDQRMARTADRPVATHQVPVGRALAFGLGLAVASLWAFWLINPLAAALGLSAILFYSLIYTLMLKPNTVQNTVIGGAAGALPALIGWAAVTGEVGVPGLALAALIFLWTPAHFYNLAMAYADDYARGGFPMMPVVRGETETRKHVVYYLAATLVAAATVVATTDLGLLTAGATVGFGGLFLYFVIRLHREQTEAAAFRAFHASNAYLGVVMVAIVTDALVL
jgi:protoheme IX farnesyltransferase